MNALRQTWGGLAAWCARRAGEGQLDRALRLIAAAIVLWFPAACLLVNRSDSVSLIFLGAIGLCVWVRSGFRAGLSRRDWLFVTVFVAFFLTGVLAFEFGIKTDEGFRLLGRYIRFLFALPVLLALRRYPPPAPAVWAGLGVAALLLGLDAVWESMTAGGFLRPDGDTNVAILFGDLATLTTFIFAAGYLYIDGRLTRIGPILVVVCVLMGLLASFLSGTRGAWVAVPVLLVLFLTCRHLLHPRVVLVGSGVAATLFALLVMFPQTHILERIESTVTQLKTYHGATAGSHGDWRSGGCFDNLQALQAWIDASDGNYPPGFSVSAEPATGVYVAELKNLGCAQGALVHFHNSSKRLAWMIMPRFERNLGGMASTQLLVDGYGSAGFSRWRYGQNPIHAGQFIRRDFSAPAQYGGGVTVMVRPGTDFLLVPVETYFGEYRYTLLLTPVSQRLEMWRAAWLLFRQAPVFGMGTGAYQDETGVLVAAGRVPPDIADFDHPHSDYFDALSSRGLLGFLVLVLLLGVPAWLCKDGLDSHDPHRVGAALGGVLVATGFAIFGLTETMFIHSVTIGWYVIMTAIFFVCAEAQDGRGN